MRYIQAQKIKVTSEKQASVDPRPELLNPRRFQKAEECAWFMDGCHGVSGRSYRVHEHVVYAMNKTTAACKRSRFPHVWWKGAKQGRRNRVVTSSANFKLNIMFCL